MRYRTRFILMVFAALWIELIFLPAPAVLADMELVSIAGTGAQGNGSSNSAAISSGRFVAFKSYASTLVPEDTNKTGDIFVHDRTTNITERVSISGSGEQAKGDCHQPAISANGRFVAFNSYSNNLASGDTNGLLDIFVHDRQTGYTERVSISGSGQQANYNSYQPSLSADGRYVAFYSFATNLVPNDSNGKADIFVHDRQTGDTERVSISGTGQQANGNSYRPSISADGQLVAFYSLASNLVPGDTNNCADVFVHDRQTGATERVSISGTVRQGNKESSFGVISPDGRYVAFHSYATNLVPGDRNGQRDVFRHDRQTGETVRVSISSDGEEGNGHSGYPAISRYGKHVVFNSAASNLVHNDTNKDHDIFLHFMKTGNTVRLSRSDTGKQGNAGSACPAISPNGRLIAFESDSNNLVPGDKNLLKDIFVHNRE